MAKKEIDEVMKHVRLNQLNDREPVLMKFTEKPLSETEGGREHVPVNLN